MDPLQRKYIAKRVYTYPSLSLLVGVSLSLSLSVLLSIYMYVLMYMYICICIYTYGYVHFLVRSKCMYVRMYVCTRMYTQIVCIYIYVYVWIDMCVKRGVAPKTAPSVLTTTHASRSTQDRRGEARRCSRFVPETGLLVVWRGLVRMGTYPN